MLTASGDKARDDHEFEMISAWFVGAKAQVFTRVGTRLDEKPQIWGEILAGIIENLCDHVKIGGLSKRECALEISEIVRKHFVRDEP
jgi:hypothetical protein